MDIDGKRPSKLPEADLDSFRKSAQAAGDALATWIDYAKELKETLDQANQSLATEQARNSSINADFSALQDDYRALKAEHTTLRSSHNALVASKESLESNITSLTNATNQASDIIGRSVRKMQKLEDEKNACKARVEVLEFDLAASDALAEALEVELARLRAAHTNDVSGTEQGMIVKGDDNESSLERIESLQASIDRLQRKYDRLVAKKESAEKRFYTAYVEWHGFKQWWLGFVNFPGVSTRMVAYNREVKSGTWVPSRQGVGTGEKGRVLRVIETAEADPNAFPNIVHESEPKDEEQDEQVDERLDPEERLEQVCSQAQRIYSPPTTPQADHMSIQSLTTPRESDIILSGPRGPPDRGDDRVELQSDGLFDPDKTQTQETTPAKSQAPGQPLRPNMSGLGAPFFNIQNPVAPLPRLLSPEPSQVVVIKDESQDIGALLRPVTTLKPKPLAKTIKPTTTPNASTGNQNSIVGRHPTSPPPPIPPSTLGKRKMPADDVYTPGTNGRRPGRVEMQLQLIDGTIVSKPNSVSTAKKRRGLDDDDEMDSPSVRPVTGKGKVDAKDVNGSRGRKSEGTLNSRYEINPARNGGLNFAFDEVVRKKAERKKMEAGTCADCIEYYRVVGPMPPRAQGPLWKTPTSSQEDAKGTRTGCTCAKDKSRGGNIHGEDDDDDEDTSAHQKAISRHRVYHAAPETPPDYWEVGFPSTQQTKKINESAERIHERKERVMEMEARKSDGKYRRR